MGDSAEERPYSAENIAVHSADAQRGYDFAKSCPARRPGNSYAFSLSEGSDTYTKRERCAICQLAWSITRDHGDNPGEYVINFVSDNCSDRNPVPDHHWNDWRNSVQRHCYRALTGTNIVAR